MYLQGVESIFDITLDRWAAAAASATATCFIRTKSSSRSTTSSTPTRPCCCVDSTSTSSACNELLAVPLALPAYEQVLKASHTFNLLDARGAHLGHRAGALHPARAHAGACAWRRAYYASREALGFPMLRRARPHEPARRPRSDARRDFLVELGTEELPPKALRTLEQAFADAVVRATERTAAQIRRRDLVRDAAAARAAGAAPEPAASPISR